MDSLEGPWLMVLCWGGGDEGLSSRAIIKITTDSVTFPNCKSEFKIRWVIRQHWTPRMWAVEYGQVMY